MDPQDNPNSLIAADLRRQGWAVRPGYFAADLTAALLADMKARDEAGEMAQAAIGRADGAAVDKNVRTDRTLWLTPESDAARRFLAVMEDLRRDLNAALFMGLFEYEAHYAIYAPGGFYRKHVDALKGGRNRVISTVSYLTPGWAAADGGHLVLYDPEDENREAARILPVAGTLAVFLSEEVPHEVLPPARARASIAGWFRCNNSTGARIDPLG